MMASDEEVHEERQWRAWVRQAYEREMRAKEAKWRAEELKKTPEVQLHKLEFSTMIQGWAPTSVYKSQATDLTIVVHKVPGPLVNGYIALATRTLDDDGLPHCLEHLVFMGSESCPWKGVLDLMANRSFASGTNAWTAQDHTAYTLKTAGSQGFCKLLPYYLDHVLFPTLADSAFLTEVHHINGKGEDGGVVYSEMQSIENTQNSLINRALKRTLYPGKSGYGSNSGGALRCLRESLTNRKVRAYHKNFYRTSNVWVIVVGDVEDEDVLGAVAKIERKMVEKASVPDKQAARFKPWSCPVPLLKQTVERDVFFPASEEDTGTVDIAWRGPTLTAPKGLKKLTCVGLLMDYLTDAAISPLRKAFVEIDVPYASRITADILDFAESALIFIFHDVPVGKQEQIAPKLHAVLESINEDNFDIDRMRTIIHRSKIDVLLSLESEPSTMIANETIAHMLYDPDYQNLSTRLNRMELLENYASKGPEFWIKYLRLYFDQKTPHVVIRGKPSIELGKKNTENEKARVEQQKEILGEAGLRKREVLLRAAVAANERKPDPAVLKSISVPDPTKIRFHGIESYANFRPSAKHGNLKSSSPFFNLSAIPFRMRLDDVHSNFVHLSVIINTSKMDESTRHYLPLYLKTVKETGLKMPASVPWFTDDPEHATEDAVQDDTGEPGLVLTADGQKLIPHEMAVAQLEKDTQGVSAGLGFDSRGAFNPGPFSQYAVFNVLVELPKYKEGIQWLRNLIFYPEMDLGRVQIIATKLAQSVAQKKKEGRRVALALIKDLNYSPKSNIWASGMIRQQRLLSEIAESLTKAQQKLEKLRKVREALIEDPDNFFIHMATDLTQLSKQYDGQRLEDPWLEAFGQEGAGNAAKFRKDDDEDLKRDCGVNIFDQIPLVHDFEDLKWDDLVTSQVGLESSGIALGLRAVESSYLYRTAPCEIRSYFHEDYAAMLVFLQYFKQVEGPIWKAVRGQGLAYSYGLDLGVDDGLLRLFLGMSSNITAAYRETEKLLVSHLFGNSSWDEGLVESAKSSLIFDLVEREATVSDLIAQSVIATFQERPADFFRNLLQTITDVTTKQMVSAGKRHMSAFFQANKKSTSAVVCHPGKLEEVVKDFKEGFNLHLKPFTSIEETPLNEPLVNEDDEEFD